MIKRAFLVLTGHGEHGLALPSLIYGGCTKAEGSYCGRGAGGWSPCHSAIRHRRGWWVPPSVGMGFACQSFPSRHHASTQGACASQVLNPLPNPLPRISSYFLFQLSWPVCRCTIMLRHLGPCLIQGSSIGPEAGNHRQAGRQAHWDWVAFHSWQLRRCISSKNFLF